MSTGLMTYEVCYQATQQLLSWGKSSSLLDVENNLIMRIIVLVACVVMVANLGGCIMECPSTPSDPIKDKEVFGIYCANFGDAKRDCIELLPDSLYVHFYVDSMACHLDTASWRYFRATTHSSKVALWHYTVYHPREGGVYVPVPGDTITLHQPLIRCYEPAPDGVVDTAPVTLPMLLRKRGKRTQLEYCWGKFENYIKVDSATAEEIREEMRQCLTGE